MKKVIGTKLLEKYKPCEMCKKVLVKRVYNGFIFKPVCCECRAELRQKEQKNI
ncbi:hypothetical protein KO361_05960 [Candidatus Woesearchaeota archaeon]|nr:hypothetical protein [Candidatus Woesearchaeota archaeon]